MERGAVHPRVLGRAGARALRPGAGRLRAGVDVPDGARRATAGRGGARGRCAVRCGAGLRGRAGRDGVPAGAGHRAGRGGAGLRDGGRGMSDGGKDLKADGLALVAKGLTEALGELKELGMVGEAGAGRGFSDIALSGLELGHEGLTGDFKSFCERWEWGVRSLINEGNGFALKTGLS